MNPHKDTLDVFEEFSDFFPHVTFQLIPIKDLVSNQDYQRDVSEHHVAKMTDHFDPNQINPVKVSRRDGVNYVFDGQHTIEAVAAASGSRETPVWCMIFDDLNYKHEASIFAEQQKYQRKLSPYDIFAANIEAGSSGQVTIKGLVESLGLRIGKKSAPNVIRGVSALEWIYQRYGYHLLERTLMLCIGAWEGEAESLSGRVVKGVALVLNVYGDRVDNNVFKERLSEVSIRSMKRMADDYQGKSSGYARAIIDVYNKRFKRPPLSGKPLKWG